MYSGLQVLVIGQPYASGRNMRKVFPSTDIIEPQACTFGPFICYWHTQYIVFIYPIGLSVLKMEKVGMTTYYVKRSEFNRLLV